MAESVDSQLKRMAQDLKEIIEQMNEANRHQDEDSTVSRHLMCHLAHTHVHPPTHTCTPTHTLAVPPDSENSERTHGLSWLDRQRNSSPQTQDGGHWQGHRAQEERAREII